MQAQAVHDQLPRKRAVFGADADRPEQGGVLAVAADVGTDTLPQQIQRLWIALVARLHERATHFQTGAEAVEKSAIVAEQLAGIQAIEPASGEQRNGGSDAVRADDLEIDLVPQNQVHILSTEPTATLTPPHT